MPAKHRSTDEKLLDAMVVAAVMTPAQHARVIHEIQKPEPAWYSPTEWVILIALLALLAFLLSLGMGIQ